MWELPQPVQSALARLNAAGFEAYIVGGCVRDRLLGQMPRDYDITTSALPEQTLRVFAGERCIETGMKHGTVTVLLDGMPLELTTYRIDGTYADARHPDTVTFTPSLREDLARRDFTVNAMAYSPETGLVDPFGGQADLKNRILRCVGDPARRFSEDALRILRCLRFSAALDFEIEGETAAALRALAPALSRVSAERLRDELLKLLCGTAVQRILCLWTDVLGVFLPELPPLRGFDQKNPHHCYDVLTHCAAAVAAAPAEQPLLRLAALLHDVGKPVCFTVGDDGIGHFYGHAEQSAALADGICRRLRLSNAQRTQVVTLVKYHDLRPGASERSVRRALNRLSPEVFFDLLTLQRADVSALAPGVRAARLDALDALEQQARGILARGECFSLKDLAVKGDDLLAAGGAPGPAVGQALNRLLELVADGELPNEKSALLAWYQGFQDK